MKLTVNQRLYGRDNQWELRPVQAYDSKTGKPRGWWIGYYGTGDIWPGIRELFGPEGRRTKRDGLPTFPTKEEVNTAILAAEIQYITEIGEIVDAEGNPIPDNDPVAEED